MVSMARGSTLHEGLSRLLPHAIDLIERNEGVPLAPRALFAGIDDPGVLLVVSDHLGSTGPGNRELCPTIHGAEVDVHRARAAEGALPAA
eukprot:scaffold54842_cov103-Phaeocystis_antarctica.AAC.1